MNARTATELALASIKLNPTRFMTMTWKEVKDKVGSQIKAGSCPGQRNHEAQLVSGWNHIKRAVMATQGTLQFVEYDGPAKALMPEYVLTDGFHRTGYWMGLEDGVKITDACPFKYLNIEVTTVYATTVEEAEMLTDEIARTFNSKESVKHDGDYLAAAVRQAGLKATSTAYALGKGSGLVSFLGRVVGKAHVPTPTLTARAASDLPAHVLMDMLLHLVESESRLRSLRGRIFNPGVMQALFERFQRLNAAGLELASEQLSLVLTHVGKSTSSKLMALDSVSAELLKSFNKLHDEAFCDLVRSQGNREQQYDYVFSYLRKKLTILGTPPKTSSSAGTKR